MLYLLYHAEGVPSKLPDPPQDPAVGLWSRIAWCLAVVLKLLVVFLTPLPSSTLPMAPDSFPVRGFSLVTCVMLVMNTEKCFSDMCLP